MLSISAAPATIGGMGGLLPFFDELQCARSQNGAVGTRSVRLAFPADEPADGARSSRFGGVPRAFGRDPCLQRGAHDRADSAGSRRAMPEVPKQVVIVDDCSSDGPSEWLRRNFARAAGVWRSLSLNGDGDLDFSADGPKTRAAFHSLSSFTNEIEARAPR